MFQQRWKSNRCKLFYFAAICLKCAQEELRKITYFSKNANGGMSDCRMKGMFSSEDGKPLDDPREPRPVATARYELYWAWAQHYEAHSQILLIDSRDTIFQKNPFEGMTASEADAGILRFYGVSKYKFSPTL